MVSQRTPCISWQETSAGHVGDVAAGAVLLDQRADVLVIDDARRRRLGSIAPLLLGMDPTGIAGSLTAGCVPG
jgi:hypothetical protein